MQGRQRHIYVSPHLTTTPTSVFEFESGGGGDRKVKEVEPKQNLRGLGGAQRKGGWRLQAEKKWGRTWATPLREAARGAAMESAKALGGPCPAHRRARCHGVSRWEGKG